VLLEEVMSKSVYLFYTGIVQVFIQKDVSARFWNGEIFSIGLPIRSKVGVEEELCGLLAAGSHLCRCFSYAIQFSGQSCTKEKQIKIDTDGEMYFIFYPWITALS